VTPLRGSASDKSWVNTEVNSDFPIQNLPFGIFKNGSVSHTGVAIGSYIVDLHALSSLGYLKDLGFDQDCFATGTLNAMMKRGKKACTALRERIYQLLKSDDENLQNNKVDCEKILVKQSDAVMLLPVEIGDYTDFYSSREHAYNVGVMFRDPANALLPNWLHLPVAYHGRSSSILCSGEPVRRPKGQSRPDDQLPPVFGPTKQLDFELEMGFLTYSGKPLGESISTDEADDYIFGMCLFNDWSARDIQKWEYVPLGPFLAKNFASSMSPWIVMLDALEPFRVSGPVQEPEVLPYLKYSGKKHFNIQLEVVLQTPNGDENLISKSNYKNMYWNMNQQLAHHTVNGCNIRCGDLLASGTISGSTPDSYGSMLELAWKGTKPLKLKDGSERRFIHDGDTIAFRGYCENAGYRIGFGEVKSTILPSI